MFFERLCFSRTEQNYSFALYRFPILTLVLFISLLIMCRITLQATCSSVFDGEELKKLGEQFGQSGLSIINHVNSLLGVPISAADNQKTYEKVKGFITKGQSDVSDWNSPRGEVAGDVIRFFYIVICPCVQLETELVKLKESVRKNLDPKIVEKIDDFEKEIKKQSADAKSLFEDKVAKPINDKYKDDVKKITDSVLKTTKDVEVSSNTL